MSSKVNVTFATSKDAACQTGRAGESTAASSTAAKSAAPGTAGERPLPRPIQAAATSLAA